MILHALVADFETARRAVEGGATVVQVRLKSASTAERASLARAVRALGTTVIVNDDVDAALQAGADGVHLGQSDAGLGRAVGAGLVVGVSAASQDQAREAEGAGATYLGVGPIWPTPSKLDADPPIGLPGLTAVARSTSLPVIAIGGVDAGNAASCLRAGAAGVAVIRASADAAALRTVLDAARAEPC
ncbi:MAG: thiamine phosphate synthase [Candidatus Dormibacteria bacterium]